MLYPPRPEHAIAPSLIHFYEKKGWVAQVKKNGTLTVVFIDPQGAVTFKTRHGVDHKAWKATKDIIAYFSHFPDSIFICELLHSKDKSIKNTMYIFDLVRHNGKDLVGQTFEQRQELLRSVVPIAKNIILAKNYDRDLLGLFRSLQDPVDEGLVLKDPKSILRPCYGKSNNAAWQVKCRVGHKNYGF